MSTTDTHDPTQTTGGAAAQPARARPHRGSCHCGDVRFEAVVDPARASRCNCSVCVRIGAAAQIVKPEAFTLLVAESALASFTRFPEIGHRYFCRRCHVFLFSKGTLAELGGAFVSVNLNTLDDFDPSLTTFEYWDGRHDNWHAGARAEPWPVRRPSAS
jgi:hypothetical protein